MRRYWDSCCFIAIVNGEDAAEDCQNILEDAMNGKCQIVVSTVGLVEVVKYRRGGKVITKSREETIRQFFEHECFILRDLDRPVAELARRISRDYNIKPHDAIHIATAIDMECDLLETTDDRVLALASKSVGIAIAKPKWSGQTEFPYEGDKGHASDRSI